MGRTIRAFVRIALLVPLAACGAPAGTSISFVEVVDERVPAVGHSETIGGHSFWGPGLAASDVDGDGRVDVYLSGAGLFINRLDPRGFRLERAAIQPPAVDLEPLGVAFADYDRDGDMDLTLCGEGGVRLLANDGAAGFAEVTENARVAGPTTDVCVETAWGDVDGDGYLDLAVATYGNPSDRDDAELNRLYLNQRDGTFAPAMEVVGGAGMERRSLVAAFADFDADGVLDLYFGDDQIVDLADGVPRGDQVFVNRGLDANDALQLVESSESLGFDGFRATMGCAFGNPARGGGWDVFLADIFRGWFLHGETPGVAFENVTDDRGDDLRGPTDEKWVMWGGRFADFDGDGYEELIVGQAPVAFGERNQELLGPVLLRNRGGTYERERYGLGEPMLARGIALADLDGDGDDDLIVAPYFGAFRFFVNESATRDFVRVELDSTISAPGAAGAIVEARAGTEVQKRMVIAGGSPFAAGPPVVDVAAPGAAAVDLTIRWPSGAVQELAQTPTRSTVVATEPQWLIISNWRPPAEGKTVVIITVDLAAAGVGGPGSTVSWSSSGISLEATADGDGKAVLMVPARDIAGSVRGTLGVDGVALPIHPALDYQ